MTTGSESRGPAQVCGFFVRQTAAREMTQDAPAERGEQPRYRFVAGRLGRMKPQRVIGRRGEDAVEHEDVKV